jgi:hypothetical protein
MSMMFGQFNQNVSSEHDRQYAKNAAENYARIKADFQKADYSIDTLPRFAQNVPALIIGSGPSLDAALPFLGAFQGILFACPSQLNVLEKWELTPTYVTAIDTADSVAREQILDEAGQRDFHGMTLLTHPYISPAVLAAWTGNRRYFQLIANDPHFQDVYPWIKTGFSIAGSSSNIQVMIARWMGCSPIILAGVDYCFPEGRMRFQDYRKRGPYIFQAMPLQYMPEEAPSGRTGASQEVLFYASLLLGIWKMTKAPLVQVGTQGACHEIPTIAPEDICKKIEVPEIPQSVWDEVDKHMAEYGIHAEVDEDGIGRFSYKDKDLAAVEEANKALDKAMKAADAWNFR